MSMQKMSTEVRECPLKKMGAFFQRPQAIVDAASISCGGEAGYIGGGCVEYDAGDANGVARAERLG